MALRNTTEHYGSLSIALHWLMALAIISLYFVGDYMVELTYYDKLYHTLPHLHKSIGVLVGLALVLRLAWLYSHPHPTKLATTPEWQHTLARLGHIGLYVLILALIISGYLISTAKGKGIEVFNWFEIPALLAENAERGEIAGKIHEYSATLLMLLVLVHAGAALLHHFYWKDNTLKRMLGRL
ncbi:MAG: cytochrome b [Thiofilum sp.]|uniref:cytochrome b n=1 Tax=Thiofilum sp. TaxID=2212733 RepID=UPI0025FF4670|nr:cytochrome b [Thiofilum sp.]MBK8452562.1 cytochrome b [Thiofilum sp.]